MRYSQGIFRLFLGIADIIVGLIVLPTAVNMILKTFQHDFQLQTPIKIVGQERFLSANGRCTYKNTTLTINMLKTITVARNRLFSLVYKNSIGFFTNVSITASIYLLTASGIDQLLSLVKPSYYNQNVAKRFAISSSIVCWILAIFVSAIPTFVSGLSYQIAVSNSVLFLGAAAVTLYLVMIILPLVATWIILVCIFLIGRKVFGRIKNLPNDQDNFKKQRQLNFIVLLMLNAFSFSLLPAVLVLILLHFILGIDPQSPNTYNSTNDNIANSLELTSAIILTSNSVWNFLIYSFRTKTFRNVAMEKFQKFLNQVKCCKLF